MARPTRDGAHGRRQAPSRLSDDDLHLFNEGRHFRLWERLGAHVTEVDGAAGVHFAVWAPNAEEVSVIGDFNGWEPGADPMEPRGTSGIWERFVPGAAHADTYKLHVRGADGNEVDKADPFAVHAETPPRTASKVWTLDHDWGDDDWMAARADRQALDAPMAVYELHAGSWRRHDDGSPYSYRRLADVLPDYLDDLGFTHVELLPVMEHPFGGSWGYQTTGYFAPTSRFGTPQDLMHLVDALHDAGIGVLLDWVPSHFPTDEHGPGFFDGTHLFEHADPRQGYHPDWNSYIFNYGRHEVVSFLISSARYWLEVYHADGLRVDAVASMLYLDYSREEGEWIPNEWGGNENVAAIRFLRTLNEEVEARHPGAQMIAEESTAWPMVSRPTSVGGLGFGLKWDLGWMHDTLEVFRRDPVHRSHHHDKLTFRGVYGYTENFMLPLSHDEVVHGKGSLLGKMPGDDWQQRANLRALYAYMFTLPGKKLLFMGAELGQRAEWDHDTQLHWGLLDDEDHAGLRRCVADLARLYRGEPALHEGDCEPFGFDWIDADDREHSVLAYERRAADGSPAVVVCNLTPVVRDNRRVGVPAGGVWEERFNSDAEPYGGSGVGNLGAVEADPLPDHGRSHSVVLTLPPLGVLVLTPRDVGALEPTSEAPTRHGVSVTGRRRADPAPSGVGAGTDAEADAAADRPDEAPDRPAGPTGTPDGAPGTGGVPRPEDR